MPPFFLGNMFTRGAGSRVENRTPSPVQGGRVFPFLSLLLFLALIYANSFDCSWHFDDYKNIVDNDNIRIRSLGWPDIRQALEGMGNGYLRRPLSYLGFALNHRFGGLAVFGYHLFNFLIHYLSSVFLFLFVYRTLQLPLLENRYRDQAASIALLATLLWSTHPLHVTAVTYIVQRMTSQAALFYIMAMFFYLKARTAERGGVSLLYFSLTALSALAALASKENAAMLPVSLFFFDLFLLQGVRPETVKKSMKIGTVVLLFLFLAMIIYALPSDILAGYATRPFTLSERLLTEPRVIVFYMTLLIYPLTSRMTLLHDIEVSKSLFEPWTTLPAIGLIAVMIVLSFAAARRRPLIAFSIVFFFLNHLIEGSFIPLELIYEHRNYLPSMFFFVPVAVAVVEGVHRFRQRRVMVGLLLAAVAVLLVAQGAAVAQRNEVLYNEWTLWSDNVEKSPGLFRPHHNLAVVLMISGQFPEAYAELKAALKARDVSGIHLKMQTHFYLGQYYRIVGQDDNAMAQFQAALKLAPLYADPYQGIADILSRRNEQDAAEAFILKAISLDGRNADFHLSHGIILLRIGRPAQAIEAARRALLSGGDARRAYAIIGNAFRLINDDRSADHFNRLACGPC